MTVAVSGSAGFIGKKLVRKLKEFSYDVIELDIANGIDILDWKVFKKIKHFEVFIHLAALSFVPLSYKMPRDFFYLNLNGVINSLELCRINSAKFIFASSYVYGIPKYLPIDEKHPIKGFNPYSETKIIGEEICNNYFKYFNVQSIILRPFNVYGPGQNKNFLIPMILEQAKSGIIKLNDPKPKRDFVYVDDLVNAYLLAIKNNHIDFEKINIGSGISYSVHEVADIINKIFDNTLTISYLGNKRENEISNTVADISKARTLLNWKPKYNLFEGLKKIVPER